MEKAGSSRRENFEHVLMCLICRNLFDDYEHQPKFLPCHHTFCKDCLSKYIRQMEDEIECPSCRTIPSIPVAGVAALQTNFYIKYIQALLSGVDGLHDSSMQCIIHQQENSSFVYCDDCQTAVCSSCLIHPELKPESNNSCHHQSTRPLSSVTDESHQLLHSTFHKATTTLEKKKVQLKALLKGLSHEKDEALKKIDSTFEQHVHTLHRRATLLKNNVIDIFSENVQKIESDLMEILTAVTCIVSLKELQENNISRGEFKDFKKSIAEICEVTENIEKQIKLSDDRFNFEDAHGAEKFQMSIKDLGRVKCVRKNPMQPRAEPEGKDGGALESVSMVSAKKTTAEEGLFSAIRQQNDVVETVNSVQAIGVVNQTISNGAEDKDVAEQKTIPENKPLRKPIINPGIQKQESKQSNKPLKKTSPKAAANTFGLTDRTGKAKTGSTSSTKIHPSPAPKRTLQNHQTSRQTTSIAVKKTF